jgi:hypothetical protein
MKPAQISEAVYEKETTELSRLFVNHIKQFSGEQPDNLSASIAGVDVVFFFEEDPVGELPRVGDAGYDASKQEIEIHVDWPSTPFELTQAIQEMLPDLKNAIRHELEHHRQVERGARDSSWRSDWKQHNAARAVKPVSGDVMDRIFKDAHATRKYFLSPLEIEAFVMGAYKQAKSMRVPLSKVLKANIDEIGTTMDEEGIPVDEIKAVSQDIWNAWTAYVKTRLPKAIMERRNGMSTKLKDILPLWEEAEKSWESGEPEASYAHQPEKGETKEKPYKRPKVFIASQDTPSGINTLEEPETFVPGKDKDASTMQLDQEQELLHKLKEELEALAAPEAVEEGMITPDMGTSVLGRSLFSGAAVQPPNGYGKNFDPSEPAPEELPPGYQRNFDADVPASEEGSGFQNQDVANTIIAPKQFVPKEGVHRRLAEHLQRQRMMKLGQQ